MAPGGQGGATEVACVDHGGRGGAHPFAARGAWSWPARPAAAWRRSTSAACSTARGGGRRAQPMARRSSTALLATARAPNIPPSARIPDSLCARTGYAPFGESRRRLLQRCFSRRFGLGARALAVASRGDGASVCKPNEGVFCKKR